MPAGRPTVVTGEVLRQLEEAFSVGATDREACFLADISESTLYLYQQENPGFSERKEALKEMPKYKAKKNVVGAIEKGDVQQSNWYLERKGKDDGFSSRTELTGQNGGPVKHSVALEDSDFKAIVGTYATNRGKKDTSSAADIQ